MASIKRVEYDYDPHVSADRIGQRIRAIRLEKNISLLELSQKLDTKPSMIQHYESGLRRPKVDMIKRIAEALNVSELAISDPVIADETSVMYSFFELQDLYGIKVSEDKNTETISLSFPKRGSWDEKGSRLYRYLRLWLNEVRKVDEVCAPDFGRDEDVCKEALHNYKNWMWSFGNMVSDDEAIKEARVLEIQEQMQALQSELTELTEIRQ